MIHVTSENSNDLKIIQISNILVSSVETTTKVENSQWKRRLWHIDGAPLKLCFGFIHYAFGFVYNLREILGFFLSFKNILVQKSPCFRNLC